jgi:hypothetical protein
MCGDEKEAGHLFLKMAAIVARLLLFTSPPTTAVIASVAKQSVANSPSTPLRRHCDREARAGSNLHPQIENSINSANSLLSYQLLLFLHSNSFI